MHMRSREEWVRVGSGLASARQNQPPQPHARASPQTESAFAGPIRRMGFVTGDSEQLMGGELNAAVTSALVGIHSRYLGRGPKTASTFHHGNVLVTLMHDVLTHAEKSLTQTGQIDAVNHIRRLFQETMATDFQEAVERLMGRNVIAFIGGHDIDPDHGPPRRPGCPVHLGQARHCASRMLLLVRPCRTVRWEAPTRSRALARGRDGLPPQRSSLLTQNQMLVPRPRALTAESGSSTEIRPTRTVDQATAMRELSHPPSIRSSAGGTRSEADRDE